MIASPTSPPATVCSGATGSTRRTRNRAATPEQLAGLHRYRATILRLVDAGNPDVTCALWPPGGLHWQVARLSVSPTARLLSVHRCDVGTAGSERRAWRALKAALVAGLVLEFGHCWTSAAQEWLQTRQLTHEWVRVLSHGLTLLQGVSGRCACIGRLRTS